MKYEDMHEYVCDAIMDKNSISYPNYRGSINPYESNDLGDKVYQYGGQLLQAYIRGDDQQILNIMKKLCNDEIESLIDLVWG
jgi:hypothetical protein